MSKDYCVLYSIDQERGFNIKQREFSIRADSYGEESDLYDPSDQVPRHVIEESKRNYPDIDNLNYEQLLEY
jgi:hypothetical protein